MKIDEALQGVSRLAFDTTPIIYFVEANPAYDKLVSNIFNRVASGSLEGWTSVISLSEVLVQPIVSRRKQRPSAQEFQLPGDSNKYGGRGKRRAYPCGYGFRLPDAIQIAFALNVGCQAIVTNDESLRRITELSVLILDDLEL